MPVARGAPVAMTVRTPMAVTVVYARPPQAPSTPPGSECLPIFQLCVLLHLDRDVHSNAVVNVLCSGENRVLHRLVSGTKSNGCNAMTRRLQPHVLRGNVEDAINGKSFASSTIHG